MPTPPRRTANSEAWRADIDGLRAIAVLLVVAFHAYPAMAPGGFVGVDIFFVISGYLISGILFDALTGSSFEFGGFYLRRVRRIFPALAVVLTACLALGYLTLLPDELNQLGRHAAGGAGFASNFVLLAEAGYFDHDSTLKPLLHLWSLGIEEQFYLVWPAMLFLAHRRGGWGLCLCLVFLFSFSWSVYLTIADPIAAFYSPASRFWELAMGGLLAWTRLPANEFSRRVASWLPDAIARIAPSLVSAFGLALILASALGLTKQSVFPGLLALAPTAGGAFIIAAGSNNWLNRRVLGHRLMVAIGAISYPLYLWHWPLLSFVRIVSLPVPFAAAQAGAVVAAFLAAGLTYRYVERPIRGGPASLRRLMPIMIVMLALGCIGYVATHADLGGRRIWLRMDGAGNLKENIHQLEWFPADAECIGLLGLEQEAAQVNDALFCSLSHVAHAPSVAVVGDSNANHLFPGMAKLYGQRGQGVINIGNSTCPPFRGLKGMSPWNRPCETVNQKIYAFLLAHAEIDTVIVGLDPWDIRYMEIPGVPLHAPLAERYTAMRRLVAADIGVLTRAGKHVVVTFDSPHIEVNPRECLAHPDHCTLPREPVRARMEPYVEQWSVLISAIPSACTFAQDPVFRDYDGDYQITIQGKLAFRDHHHLSYFGSDLVADAYARSGCMARVSPIP